ncbi:DHA2 family efflux MFS transporter permease subunit [Acinetobacter equi]|uniref:Multidrug resistance protein B n=1 Tax=Acinetobacter equi TaxID=1324350 RepID=A0A0N9VPP1_9GAMM|nr:DHA2 family efflux MFS transporter permease subunit [Acinetobacter equi]ALH95321.1 multidrug resistance protein B [Acinetobacter equi]
MNQVYPISDLKGGRLILAAFVLALANFMVVLDMTIANVSVPHISGSLAVSASQGTWVITSYAVAEAICVPLTGWLAGRFGAVRTFAVSLFGFTIFSILCGLSTSLEMLIFCRIGQGLFGGPIMPLSQTLLMRIFPQEKQSQAMGMWAMTTVLGPILGPILGGTISDNWSWHWIFFINIPVGLVCAYAVMRLLKSAETPTAKLKIDMGGLLLLVLWIGALQLMLDLGHEKDWFNNPFIVILAITSFVGLIIFTIWELTERHPIVNIQIFRYRGFTISVLALAFGFGAFFGSIVLIPQWLQINLGYTASWAGLLTATMGLGSLTMSPIAAKLAMKYDQRALASFGLCLLGGVTLMRAFWTTDADFMALAWPQILQGFAVPFFFIPLSNMALGAVKPHEMAAAAGLMNFLRTMAGAIGASIAVTIWADHAKISRAELSGLLHIDEVKNTLMNIGLSEQGSIAYIANLVESEANTISADYVFFTMSLVFFFAGLIIWLCPKPKAGMASSENLH